MNRQSRRGKVTLNDVAARAGVSPSTVSKVLNSRSDVSAATRERVLSVVAETGYQAAPRRDRGGRQALTVVLDFLASPYAGTLMQEMLAAATELEADLRLSLPPGAPAEVWVAEQRAAGVVGLIELAVPLPGAVLAAARDRGLPVVAIDPLGIADPRAVTIGSANWAGGRAVTEHVIRFGHTDIAWVGGPLHSAPSAERFQGYRAALDAANLVADPALICHDAFTVEAGFRHGRRLLALDRPPTAVVAGNDEIAIGVLAAARERGVDVPRDLSVTGFDGTPLAEWATPGLTSVEQPLAGMGRMAVETVLGMARGVRPASRHLQLATTLTVRDSTGPVSA